MNKLKGFLSFILVLFLSSCACQPKIITIQPPIIKLPPNPENTTGKLNSKSSPDEVIKAWVATAVAYRGWNQAVRKQIESLSS